MARLEMYPSIWKTETGLSGSEYEYLWGGFETLREFVRVAKERGQGIVVYLS